MKPISLNNNYYYINIRAPVFQGIKKNQKKTVDNLS
jgi:hypothetical protein